MEESSEDIGKPDVGHEAQMETVLDENAAVDNNAVVDANAALVVENAVAVDENAVVGENGVEVAEITEPVPTYPADWDEIDIIINTRQVKISIPIPNAEHSMGIGKRLGVTFLSNEDFLHVMDEVKGGVYGPPARPELTLLTVGSTLNEENCVQLFLDKERSLYVLSEEVKTQLLLLFQKCFRDPDHQGEVVLQRCTWYSDDIFYEEINSRSHVMWRRFCQEYIIPHVDYSVEVVKTKKKKKKHHHHKKHHD